MQADLGAHPVWTLEVSADPSAALLRGTVRRGAERACFARVVELWREDEAFRDAFVDRLAETPFEAFRWETPPVTRASFGRPFECALLDSPELAGRAAEPEVFARNLPRADDPRESVAAFPNLSGDAVLVVPAPRAEPEVYVDLATFSRRAPRAQQHELWQQVGRAVEARLADAPLWLSTAGGGVAWLHVRLDSYPKYYVHAPYRRDAGG